MNTTELKLLNTLRVMVYHADGLKKNDITRLTNIATNYAEKLHHDIGIDKRDIRLPQIDTKLFMKRLKPTDIKNKNLKAAKQTQFAFAKDCAHLMVIAKDAIHFRDTYQDLLYHIHTIQEYAMAELA